MRKIRLRTCLTGIYCLLFSLLQGQDPIFSQWHVSPMQLNPAFTGISDGPTFAFNYRNQWPQLSEAYVTYAASYDQFFKDINSGLGVVLVSDDAGQGLLKTNRIGLNYSYRLKIDRNNALKLGVEAGLINTQLGWSKLIFLDQIDPVNGLPQPGGSVVFPPSSEISPDQLSKTRLDLSAGLLYYGTRYYAGISAKHLNSPDDNFLPTNTQIFSGLPIRFTATAGANFGFGASRKGRYEQMLMPHLLIAKQGPFFQALAGVLYQYHQFYMGASYRQTSKVSDAFIMEAGLRAGILRIGYSYDATVSGTLAGSTGGSHEISILVQIEGRKETPISECFQFFR